MGNELKKYLVYKFEGKEFKTEKEFKDYLIKDYNDDKLREECHTHLRNLTQLYNPINEVVHCGRSADTITDEQLLLISEEIDLFISARNKIKNSHNKDYTNKEEK